MKIESMSSSPKSAMGALKSLWRLEKAFAKYFIKRVLLDLLLSLFCWTELSYAFGWFDRVPDDVNVGVLLYRASLWLLMFYLIRWLRLWIFKLCVPNNNIDDKDYLPRIYQLV